MRAVILPALRATLVTWVLCGMAYPLAVTGLGQWLLPDQANGSLIRNAAGAILGSRLVGQDWIGPEWFHGRPSATMTSNPNDPTKKISAPYNAAGSGGSNLGPTSRALAGRLVSDRKAVESQQPELAGRELPADMLTASGSGLDPDISPAYAALQVPRVAAARGIAAAEVTALVMKNTAGRALGIFGEPRVNVLQLNLDLDAMRPKF
jgi:potassium-transporting ATPase KdpC subunit